MLYEVHSLSTEKLNQLYIEESQKLCAAIDQRLPYNILQAIKRDLTVIDAELTQRGYSTFSNN